MTESYHLHKPVLLAEVIQGLLTSRAGNFIDATFGRGGHSKAILALLDSNSFLLGIDKDPEAINIGCALHAKDARFDIIQGSFANLTEYASAYHIDGDVTGILLDCGVSSPQLDDPARGFSFLREGPLDMRMDPEKGMSAREWIAKVELDTMMKVFKEYGEERYARRIAKAIVSAREKKPIETTVQLAEIIKLAHPAWEKNKHPATRCFQAIRIFINQELEDLKSCLAQSVDTLKIGGRIAVISFHSLEDQLVKRFFQKQAKGDDYPADLPVTSDQLSPRLKIVGKAIRADENEVMENTRARSAILRIAERIS